MQLAIAFESARLSADVEVLRAPFVWFGGKRRVAREVWEALGDVDNYVEPFAGSLAVLLGRPHRLDDGQRRAETVNDRDNYVSNFWRAVTYDPEAVAHYADWPVNECDLFARHLWLVNEGRAHLVANLEADPDWYDAKVAGWWVWGVNAWIGSGWCSGEGPWGRDGNAGRGVNRKLPHLGDAGRGVNRQLPHLGNAGRAGYNNLAYRTAGVAAYFAELAARLRDVRVCCGDWSRVVTAGALSFGATAGVFLDPPYSGEVRTRDLYASEDHDIGVDVRTWALRNGDDKRLRIVLAGYDLEHDAHIPPAWRRFRYSQSASYQTAAQANGNTGNQANRHREVLWLSPQCLDPYPTLFDLEAY
jgi:site-specific DNA-adenine methylase